jgi:hypothetical protein
MNNIYYAGITWSACGPGDEQNWYYHQQDEVVLPMKVYGKYHSGHAVTPVQPAIIGDHPDHDPEFERLLADESIEAYQSTYEDLRSLRQMMHSLHNESIDAWAEADRKLGVAIERKWSDEDDFRVLAVAAKARSAGIFECLKMVSEVAP